VKTKPNTRKGKAGAAASYVSIKKAAGIVGVTPESVRLWVRRGLLPARRFRVVQMHTMVLRSALETARTVVCLHCGKPFQARRPQKARFCCAKHRDRWNYEHKKKARLRKQRS
jgi:hypothetical protein